MDDQKKPLAQLLLEFAGQPTATNAARNHKLFMEHWDEIQAEHAKGWSLLTIYNALKAAGLIPFSYATFTSYIRKVKAGQEKAAGKPHQPRIGRAEVGQGTPPPIKREPRRF